MTILDEYQLDNIAEHTLLEASIFLDDFIQGYFDVSARDDMLTRSATTSVNCEVCVCMFTKDRNNDLSYTDCVHPDDFPHLL